MYRLLTILTICILGLSGCMQSTVNTDEIQAGYDEFSILAGKELNDVEKILGQELKFLEEKYDSQIYSSTEDKEYFFLTEANALYRIDYKNLDAEAALQLAKSSSDDLFKKYGDSPIQIKNHILDITSADDMNGKVAPQQYNEAWRVPYNQEMTEKLKPYKITEENKVTLSIDLLTDRFMNQGTYSVSISQTSLDLDAAAKNLR